MMEFPEFKHTTQQYGKLPTYVSFGTRHIPIATFEQNIATQGLKITVKAVA